MTTDTMQHASENAKGWLASIEDMLAELRRSEENDAGGSDDARQAIEESALSVSVRDGWHQPGQASEDGPEEYEILLSTGGPALRIYGRLNDFCEPDTAELQMQDWGTPWTRYNAPEETLLQFARCFWFGE